MTLVDKYMTLFETYSVSGLPPFNEHFTPEIFCFLYVFGVV